MFVYLLAFTVNPMQMDNKELIDNKELMELLVVAVTETGNRSGKVQQGNQASP